ncbi:MAG: PorT family protein [Paludibacteraceae bacterium]|nr:PorT family protein [Paludibacteraceae bacterium]
MKKLFLPIATMLALSVNALASSFSVGVEAGYDFLDFRTQHNAYYTTAPNGTNLGIIKEYFEITQAGKSFSTYTATTLKGIPIQKTVKETKNSTGRMPSMHGFHVGPTFDIRFSDKMGLGLKLGLNYQYARTNGGIFDSKNTLYDEDGTIIIEGRDLHNNSDYYKRYNTTYHGLSIPIRLYYSWDLPKNWNIWIMTGPKLNIGLSFKENFAVFNKKSGKCDDYTYNYLNGKQYVNGTLVDWDDPNGLSPKQKEEYHKAIPFNTTWGIGFGFGYKNFNFSVLYDFGMSNRYYKQSESYQWASNMYEDPETGEKSNILCVETAEFNHSLYNNELVVSIAYTFPIVKNGVNMTGKHKGEYTKARQKKIKKQEEEKKQLLEELRALETEMNAEAGQSK